MSKMLREKESNILTFAPGKDATKQNTISIQLLMLENKAIGVREITFSEIKF